MAQTGKYYEGIGRRKEATARVRIYAGQGSFLVNERPVDQYFYRMVWLQQVREPLRATQNENRFTISARVLGGGLGGQAQAVSLGVARALVAADENFRKDLRKVGVLTRDAREKERKKPGLKRARKAKQYTKR
jgi:small subunit ribosomal protein S9